MNIYVYIDTYASIHCCAYIWILIKTEQIWSCSVNSSHVYICTYTVWILLFPLNFIHFKLSGPVRGNICWFIAGVPMRSGLPKSSCMVMHSSCFSTNNQTWTTHYTLPGVCVETKPEKWGIGSTTLAWREWSWQNNQWTRLLYDLLRLMEEILHQLW